VSVNITNITVRKVVCVEAVLVDSCGGVFKSGMREGMYHWHHRQDNDIFSSRKVCKKCLFRTSFRFAC
jgi:hypothetical protein